jgi:hypothetical protein
LAEPGWLNISALPPEASADPRLEALSRIDRMPLQRSLRFSSDLRPIAAG